MLPYVKDHTPHIAVLELASRAGIVCFATAAIHFSNHDSRPFKALYERAQRVIKKLHTEKMLKLFHANHVKCFTLTRKGYRFLIENSKFKPKFDVPRDPETTAFHRIISDFLTLSIVSQLNREGTKTRYFLERQCLELADAKQSYGRRPDGILRRAGVGSSVVIEVEKSRRKDFDSLLKAMRQKSGTAPELPHEATLWVFVLNEKTRADFHRHLNREFSVTEYETPNSAISLFEYDIASTGSELRFEDIMKHSDPKRGIAYALTIEYQTDMKFFDLLTLLKSQVVAFAANMALHSTPLSSFTADS